MAKKYRMNTDTRKNIFCILFTAEVYIVINIITFYIFYAYNVIYDYRII